jgi:hypothetical protein
MNLENGLTLWNFFIAPFDRSFRRYFTPEDANCARKKEERATTGRRTTGTDEAPTDDDQGSIDAGKRRGVGFSGDGSTGGARGGDADERKRRVGCDARTSSTSE